MKRGKMDRTEQKQEDKSQYNNWSECIKRQFTRENVSLFQLLSSRSLAQSPTENIKKSINILFAHYTIFKYILIKIVIIFK